MKYALESNSLNSAKDDEIIILKNSLFKRILNIYKQELRVIGNINDRVLRVKFLKFYNESSEVSGYDEIKELINIGELGAFSKEYCVYISDENQKLDKTNIPYYEIVWDYRDYFEKQKEPVKRK